jgi:sporulation protein YlmC with PRC-barrel domain
MKKRILMSVILLAGFLPASNAVAQQQQSPQEQGIQEQQTAQPGRLRWAQKSSDILDKKIVSNDGEELGTAKDFVIGRDGKIEYVILSVGGFLGIGGERIAVPWDKIRPTPNVDLLVADVSRSEIQWEPGGAGRGDMQQAAQTVRKEPHIPFAQMDSDRAREFMERTVVGKNGEELGKMKDLFASEKDRPLYVVVQDESNKLHPVPAQFIRTNPEDDKRLSADLDKKAFLSSPSFDEAQISEQQQWEPEVRSYYQSGFQGG